MNEHSPILAQTLRVENAEGGNLRGIIFDTDPDTLALSVVTICEAESPEALAALARDIADEEGLTLLGVSVRHGTACRPGEMQHGREVILVPEVLELTWGELIGSLTHESAPAEDRDLARDPEPQNGMGDVWRWLREGRMQPLAGTDLHQAYLGASDQALYLECGETGELVIADFTEDEGLTVYVYRGEVAWELPTTGAAPVLLHGHLEESDPLGDWHGRNV